MAEEDVPMHLRRPPHPPPDQDCDDMQKIVVTPVYRGRLEESHERTRRAWRRRPWYVTRYNRISRDTQAFFDNHGQLIFASLTYLTGAIMVLILLGVALRTVVLTKKYPSRYRINAASSESSNTAV